MNGLIAWWARNSVAANLVMIGIFVAGAIGFSQMEREMDPQVRFPGLQIVVSWPGAAPQEVEEQIVARIEESVRDLDAIEWVRSSSSEGLGEVYILAEQQVDFTQFMNDVKIRLDSISSFPRDIEPPQVQQWVNQDEFMRVAVHGDIGERELKRLAETLRREAAQLTAVTVVNLFGTRQEEVSIEVSEEALRRYNLSFSEVANAIRNTSINQSAGQVRTEVGTYQLKVRSQADTETEFNNIIIRETADGGIIRVGDVATVLDGFEDNPILATLNGEPAVLLQIMSTEIMDIVTASKSVREWIEKRQESLPRRRLTDAVDRPGSGLQGPHENHRQFRRPGPGTGHDRTAAHPAADRRLLGCRWYRHGLRRRLCFAGTGGRFAEHAFHLRLPAGAGYRRGRCDRGR